MSARFVILVISVLATASVAASLLWVAPRLLGTDFFRRRRREVAAVSTIGLVVGFVGFFVAPAVQASGGSYSLNWSAANPPDYLKKQPSQLACPAPSGGTGVASDPLHDAAFGSPKTSVESLAPKDLALGQIVPFELKIAVSGTTAPENGVITFTADWLSMTTSGDNFGFDPAYGLYCAFVDTADSGNVGLDGDEKVDTFSSTTADPGTSNERIAGTIQVSGLDDGDSVVVELWVVLDKTIPAGANGNVQTSLTGAWTGPSNGKLDTISTGAQTVPLNKVQGFFTADADLSITKTDTDPVTAATGAQVTYTIAVKNNSPDTVSNGVKVTDTLDANTTFVSASGATCSGTPLVCDLGAINPGDTVTFTITVDLKSTVPNNDTTSLAEAGNAGAPAGLTCTTSPKDLCNVATVTATTADSTQTNNGYAQPTNIIPGTAEIHVVKSTDPLVTQITAAGQVVHYKFTVTNTGNVTLTGISVTDPNCAAAPSYVSGDTNADSKLQTTETWIYTCTRTVTQAEMDAGGNLTNTVTADSNESAPDTDNLSIPIAQDPKIHVTKTTDPLVTQITAAGQVVHYKFTVTNTGNVTLTGITVTDPKCDAAPVRQSGDTNADSKLQTSETWIYTCTHTVTQAEIDAGGNLSNTVTADSNESAPDQAALNIPIAQDPKIHVAKTTDPLVTQITVAGQVVHYKFTVTNTGNMTLTGITVVDPTCDAAPAYVSGDTNTDSKLQTSETWIYTCARTVTQAEIDAGGNLSNTVTADSNESAPDQAALNIPIVQAKTLGLDKSVLPIAYNKVGDVLSYTFVVTNTGNVTLTDPITITDINPIVNASCPALPAGGLVPGASITCTATYAVTQVDLDAGSVMNTATAHSGKVDSNPDSAVATAGQVRALAIDKTVAEGTYYAAGNLLHYTYVVTNTGNVTLKDPVTVTDNKVTVTCPALPAGGLAPLATITCTATYTVTQADVNAGSVTNSAYANSGVVQSPPDSVTVPVTRLGHITVVKNIVGEVAGAESAFTFAVTCGGYSTTLTIDVVTGTSASTSDALPVGTACQVTETGTYPHWTFNGVTPASPNDAKVGTATTAQGQGASNTVTFTNTRNTGVVTVEKTRVGDVSSASTTFTFELTCPAYITLAGPQFPWAQQTLTVDTSKSATATATSDPIPTGVECDVLETPTSGWQQTDPSGGAGLTVTAPATASFTNTRNAGDLQLAKSVHSAAGPNNNSGSFVAGDPHNTLVYTLTLSEAPPAELDHTGVVVTDYLPGYGPDAGKFTTSYVEGSATCSTDCTVTYDADKHLLSWAVGDFKATDEPVVMTFKVTIDAPEADANGGIPAGSIRNVGFVASIEDPALTPSNEVKTPVVAVLGEKHTRVLPRELPFTGSALPIPMAMTFAFTMLGVGVVLTAVTRRRRHN